MGLTEILQAMEREAGSQVDGIRQAAKAESAALIRQAEAEAEEVRNRYLAEATERFSREQGRLFSAAKLEVNRQMAMARAAWLDQVFNTARERLARIRNMPCYAGFLERVTREALEELGEEITIEVDSADEELMGGIVQRLGIKVEIAPSLSSFGGVRASTADGSVSVINTIEARMERGQPELVQELAALLNSEDVSWETTTATGTRVSGA